MLRAPAQLRLEQVFVCNKWVKPRSPPDGCVDR
jgi:hypothetical protein